MSSNHMKVAHKAIDAAEEILLHYFDRDKHTKLKEDQSPVTVADTKAEKAIRAVISEAFPDHGYIGEEFGSINSGEYRWIIDPIDGTKSYSRSIPFFTTELALMKGNSVVLGISNAPKLERRVTGELGKGAYLNSKKKLAVSKIKNLKETIISIGGIKHFHRLDKLDQVAALSNDTLGFKGLGDTWCTSYVAEGKLDAIIEPYIKIYDIAPLVIICKEAGGRTTDLDGKPITEYSRTFVASNGHIHDDILSYFKKKP